MCATVVVKVLLTNYVLAQCYETLKSKKVVRFYVHISPVFSCRVTYDHSHDQQVHVRGGTIIPGKGAGLTTVESRQTNSKILVAFDDDGNASGDLYIDDGDSIKPTQ